MLLGVIADDFTGASDIANTIAKGLPGQGGLRTAQFLGVPQTAAPPAIEAGVVALKSRTVPAAEALEQSLAALRWLLEQGCRQIVFKYCSTFDSTRRGNIGPVGEALAAALGVRGVIACPSFPAAGRSVYMGHLFVHDRLLNESGMQNHPLTPMADADIRRWLGQQCDAPIGFIAHHTVRKGSTALRQALAQAAEEAVLIIVDAICDDDLVTIGKAAAGHRLVTGGSGVAMSLASNFIEEGLAAGSAGAMLGAEGPEAILAGSCSGATRGQIDLHGRNHPTLVIDVDSVMAGETTADDLVSFLEQHRGEAPLAYSSGTPETVRALQERHGREAVAEKLDALFAQTARRLVAGGLRRLVVAGGETSGAVVSALDLGALTIGQEIDPGVPVLLSGGEKPIALALKSGNFGSPDFFAKALDRMTAR